MTGEIVEKDEVEGFRLIKSAAEGGNVAAMESLAQCYRLGSGCLVSIFDAMSWIQRSRRMSTS
jgi:TPR repeat protein